MTREQTKQLLQILKINYPQSFKGWDSEQITGFINLWSDAFKDTDANLVVTAIKSIIYNDTREFAPNIGQVNNKIYELTHRDKLNEQDAWNLVKKAIGRSGWYSKEEFEKLPREVQRIVGNAEQLLDWSQMDSDDINTIIASNFMRNFRNRQSQEKEFEMLPESVIIKLIGE